MVSGEPSGSLETAECRGQLEKVEVELASSEHPAKVSELKTLLLKIGS